MADIIMQISLGIMMLAGLTGLLRFVIGPTSVDRLIAFDGMTIIAVSVIVMIAYFSFRSIYLDVAVVYALLSFLGVIVVAKFIEKGL